MVTLRITTSSPRTVIAEIFVCVNILYSRVCHLRHATNFRTARAVSQALVYVHGFRMLLNFVLAAKRTESTKLNRVRTFLGFQYLTQRTMERKGLPTRQICAVF